MHIHFNSSSPVLILCVSMVLTKWMSRIQRKRKPQSEAFKPAQEKSFREHFTRLSPLHKLELRFTAIYHHNLKTLECRISFPTLPWYKPPTVYISASAKLAISNHISLMANDYLVIYTDGSGINGRIGASAVIMFSPWSAAQPIVVREKIAYIGSDQSPTKKRLATCIQRRAPLS